MRGYIYALSNAAFPNLLKIGHTTDLPESRLKQLNTTGVPGAFTLEFCFLVHNAAQIEKTIHQALVKYRYTANREFFTLPVSEALRVTVPIIQSNYTCHPVETETAPPPPPTHDLSENEVLLLQLLVSAGSAVGKAQWRLQDESSLKALDLEIHLSSLVSKKFAARERGGSYGPVWKCTPKGIKFLSDHQLVVPWMYE